MYVYFLFSHAWPENISIHSQPVCQCLIAVTSLHCQDLSYDRWVSPLSTFSLQLFHANPLHLHECLGLCNPALPWHHLSTFTSVFSYLSSSTSTCIILFYHSLHSSHHAFHVIIALLSISPLRFPTYYTWFHTLYQWANRFSVTLHHIIVVVKSPFSVYLPSFSAFYLMHTLHCHTRQC